MAKTAKETDPTDDGDAPVLDDALLTLEIRGVTFSVPKRRGRWPLEAILQFGRGNLPRAFNELLGAEQWKLLKAVCPTGDDFDAFSSEAVARLNAETVP